MNSNENNWCNLQHKKKTYLCCKQLLLRYASTAQWVDILTLRVGKVINNCYILRKLSHISNKHQSHWITGILECTKRDNLQQININSSLWTMIFHNASLRVWIHLQTILQRNTPSMSSLLIRRISPLHQQGISEQIF